MMAAIWFFVLFISQIFHMMMFSIKKEPINGLTG